jgi:hypothetical protein
MRFQRGMAAEGAPGEPGSVSKDPAKPKEQQDREREVSDNGYSDQDNRCTDDESQRPGSLGFAARGCGFRFFFRHLRKPDT